MTTEQQQQLTGFQQTYTHHCKLEETATGVRISVSIYSNDTTTAKTECLRLYRELKEILSND